MDYRVLRRYPVAEDGIKVGVSDRDDTEWVAVLDKGDRAFGLKWPVGELLSAIAGRYRYSSWPPP